MSSIVDKVKGRFNGLSSSTLGYVAVGGSAFLLLASGPRLLGGAEYSALALVWTVTTIFGLGLAFPTELTITRMVSAGTRISAVSHVARRLVLLGAVSTVVTVAVLLGGFIPFHDNVAVWLVGLLISVAGWVVLCPHRGVLGGRNNFSGYGKVLFVEAGTRIALVVSAWIAPLSWSAVLLSVAMGVPLIAAGWVAARECGWDIIGVFRTHQHTPAPAAIGDSEAGREGELEVLEEATEVFGHMEDTGNASFRGEQIAITVVALTLQIVLNVAPLWVARYPATNPDTAGMFVTSTTYMRIPIMLVGALMVYILAGASRLYSTGDMYGFKVFVWKHVGVATAATGGVTLLLWAASPVGLVLFYGKDISVSAGVLGLFALGTTVLVAASLLTQVLLGCRQSWFAAYVWILGAVVTVTLLTLFSTVWQAVLTSVLTGALAVLAFTVKLSRTNTAGSLPPPSRTLFGVCGR